ncbi:MAG: PVC-type heme-binding CxxCH protein [Limisphaerales bacterium]
MILRSLPAIILASTLCADDQAPAPFNTQEITIPFLKPAEALKAIAVPKGFRVQLAAAEPMVQQPIDMAWDTRGRLWVAECYTYAERETNFEKKLKDRIIILEDTNHDGVFDKRKIFWDGASQLTSIELGFGGVWAACAPNILFLADRNGDDQPDGEPEVILDGFDTDKVRHNIVNGLRWGPDGWLYGRHGILGPGSKVGRPGTPEAKRTHIQCGIWRYHPTRKNFEVVCHGTTNPWGHDWDEHGQLFFINTVIGHLWHAMPGARYQRMYGNHFDKHLYELIQQTADHYHFDVGKEKWSDLKKTGMTSGTDAAGGGHAHTGMMIYLGDNWPAEYRGNVFTLNLHGLRMNQESLHRQGAGYVGKHAADFMSTSDKWFRGIELSYAPDGSVYVLDWSDIGECHDNDGIHRTSGRIYRISYGKTEAAKVDLTKWSNEDLAESVGSPNEWYSRQARQLIQQRAAAGQDLTKAALKLMNTYRLTSSTPTALRAMWTLNAIGSADEDWLLEQSNDEREHIRTWAIKLLCDQEALSKKTQKRFIEMGGQDKAGLVQLQLASALQQLPLEDRWPLANALVSQDTFAKDPVFPLLVWYGINPAVTENRNAALKLVAQCKIPKVRQFIARRLAGEAGKE